MPDLVAQYKLEFPIAADEFQQTRVDVDVPAHVGEGVDLGRVQHGERVRDAAPLAPLQQRPRQQPHS